VSQSYNCAEKLIRKTHFLIRRHRDRLDKYVSAQAPYKRLVNEREIVKTAPGTLEFFEISQLLDDVLSTAERSLIKVAKHARDFGAHMKPMSVLLVRRLSDHFELSREILGSDFPEPAERDRSAR
jgi:hypothetical protein